jgi:hypothetical protein
VISAHIEKDKAIKNMTWERDEENKNKWNEA